MNAKIYDISMYITNELPKVVITDELMVTVNNRKSAVLNVQTMIMEQERKSASGELSEEEDTEYAIMEKALKLLVGEKSAKAIDELDLPIPEYKKVYETIMAAATGADPESLKETP